MTQRMLRTWAALVAFSAVKGESKILTPPYCYLEVFNRTLCSLRRSRRSSCPPRSGPISMVHWIGGIATQTKRAEKSCWQLATPSPGCANSKR